MAFALSVPLPPRYVAYTRPPVASEATVNGPGLSSRTAQLPVYEKVVAVGAFKPPSTVTGPLYVSVTPGGIPDRFTVSPTTKLWAADVVITAMLVLQVALTTVALVVSSLAT